MSAAEARTQARESAIAAFLAGVRPREAAWKSVPLPGADPHGVERRLVLERVERADFEVVERDGSLAFWQRPERLDAARPAPFEKEAALAAAAREAEPPAGEVDLEFARFDEMVGLVLVGWRHLHLGVWVEPDHLLAAVDPASKAVCSLSRRWSVVPPEAGVPEAE